MSSSALLHLASALALLTTVHPLWTTRGKKEHICPLEVRIAALCLLTLTLLQHLSDFLIYTGIISTMLPLHDLLGVISPLFWGFLLYALLEQQSRELLRQSEERMRLLLDNSDDIVLMQDLQGEYTYYKGPAGYGYTAGQVVGKTPFDIHGRETAEEIMGRLRRVVATGESVVSETRMEIEGEEVWFQDLLSPVYSPSGELQGAVAVCRNITGMKATQQELQRSLEEKQLLLKDVHHRVKNNLQMISSMLNLQAVKSDNEGCRDMLRETQARVRSIAHIHERLYRSTDLATIPYADYVRQLTQELIDSSHLAGEPVRLEVEMGELRLTLDDAVPCALILMELVSNSLKHAFPLGFTPAGGRLISINGRVEGERRLLEYRDNGKGMPAGVLDAPEAHSLGLKLIRSMANQMRGDFLCRPTREGASFLLSVPHRRD